MLPRITGTEMEYCLSIQPKPGAKFEADGALATRVFSRYRQDLSWVGQFGDNGCRYYVDVGSHPEFATPEDTSFMGTMANEVAGERIAYRNFDAARQDGVYHDFDLNKRLIDDYGTTWGHHENYLVSSENVDLSSATLALLGIHLVTVNILTGAGALIQNRDQAYFSTSQKALDLEQDYSLGTTKGKPVVNTRNEPWADADLWRRVHVTSGDANMAPWPMFVKLGSTSLVLKLIENRFTVNKKLHFEEPLYRVAQVVATDLTMQKTVRLSNGSTIRPLAVQYEIANAINNARDQIEMSAEEELVLDEWLRGCDDAANRPEELIDRVEWMYRLQFLDKFRQRHDLEWTDSRVGDMDKLWSNLGPRGIGQKLRTTVWADWMPDAGLIAEREAEAPETTRATLRGPFIRRFRDKAEAEADWQHVKYRTTNVPLYDPYATESEEVDALLMAAAA